MYWIIFGVFALLSWLVSSSLERKFKKYSQEPLPLTGAQVAEKMLRLENIKIQGKFDYMNMNQITIEARQKLAAINPETLAQASRIPGVNPADIAVLAVIIKRGHV